VDAMLNGSIVAGARVAIGNMGEGISLSHVEWAESLGLWMRGNIASVRCLLPQQLFVARAVDTANW
jgi:hypothetical protein